MMMDRMIRTSSLISENAGTVRHPHAPPPDTADQPALQVRTLRIPSTPEEVDRPHPGAGPEDFVLWN